MIGPVTNESGREVYTLIDLFSGAGGLSLGFCLTGRFRLLAGIDNNDAALKTLYGNHDLVGTGFERPMDVRQLSGEEVLSSVKGDQVDVVVGGPPCQGFSIAGRRNADDHRNQLVWEFRRLVADLNPRCFVMENVPGLLLATDDSGVAVTDVLQDQFCEIGYNTSLWKLNAADYGVPQFRKRAFLVGVKNSLPATKPRPLASDGDLFTQARPFTTVADAISDLPEPDAREPQPYVGSPRSGYQSMLRVKSDMIFNHTPSVHKPDMVERLHAQLPGTRLYPNWNHSWYKLDVNRPSPTVKENHRAPFVHPIEPRVTTPRECARLQSFPDSYVFVGTKTAQLMQIGNAVPPLLARAIASSLLEALEGAET